MCAQLRQLFALEMGVQSLADLLDEESLTRARFAPMKRLLSNQDEDYLHARIDAGEILLFRKARREAYFGYLKELRYQVRRQRILRKLAMNGSGDYSAMRADLQKLLMCKSALVYLRWLGWKRFLGIRVDGAVIEDCLALLVPEFRPISEAT